MINVKDSVEEIKTKINQQLNQDVNINQVYLINLYNECFNLL